ncbi:MAG TPA: hypothetical protein VGO50_19175 [Pyrinomonadaceae bacterium]|jgi:sugar lactone lactonase YvrE|nr:hypothetical protein [Pyrinomonadaceae bacterium]
MKISSKPPHLIYKASVTVISLVIFLALSGCGGLPEKYGVYEKAATFAGIPKEQRGALIKEPFGLAFDRKGNLFISDGEAGKIWQADKAGTLKVVTDKLDTPSGIAFDKTGDLYVADPGSHTIKKINVTSGEVSTLAGVENQPGFLDGDARTALFNAPIGVAVGEDGKIFVADTYNDRIRMIEGGKVSTIAGSGQGFADADTGLQAKFDTPCGITVTKDGGLLVADTGNARLRLIGSIDKSGKVSTLAGGGGTDTGQSTLPLDASFAEPLDVKTNSRGDIYIADASANTIYVLKQGESPTVEKLLSGKRGLADGPLEQAAFIRPAGIALDTSGNLFIADSENQLVRVLQDKDGKLGAPIDPEDAGKLKMTADEMREAAPPRWPYDPPDRVREVAGTFGEIRGNVDTDESVWFHNGLDIAGGYGETVRFIRSEKVLRPLSAQLFNTLRENLRLPTLGYIHLRLGRDQFNKPFNDPRFLFSFDESGKMSGVRVRRGTKFNAGEPAGTLNSMNHVHLIAGRSGNEMNALTALVLPGLADSIAPVIQEVDLFAEDGSRLNETQKPDLRINLQGKVRIVARVYDRMDGNAERRRLGVYRLGYQILGVGNGDGLTPEGSSDTSTTILFDKLSANPRLVYASGSKSGATGETIFNYVASNFAQGGEVKEQFFDTGGLAEGDHILRVIAADFFGNTSTRDIKIHVAR